MKVHFINFYDNSGAVVAGTKKRDLHIFLIGKNWEEKKRGEVYFKKLSMSNAILEILKGYLGYHVKLQYVDQNNIPLSEHFSKNFDADSLYIYTIDTYVPIGINDRSLIYAIIGAILGYFILGLLGLIILTFTGFYIGKDSYNREKEKLFHTLMRTKKEEIFRKEKSNKDSNA